MENTDLIRNLVYTYPERLDRGDFEGVGELFAEGRLRCVSPGITEDRYYVGKREVADFYRETVCVYDGSPATRHLITNSIIDIAHAGLEARVCSYFLVIQCLPDFPLQLIASGRYWDVLACLEGAWLFQEKVIFADYLADVSRHARVLNAS